MGKRNGFPFPFRLLRKSDPKVVERAVMAFRVMMGASRLKFTPKNVAASAIRN